MKRAIAIISAVMLLMSAAACSKSTETKSESEETSASEEAASYTDPTAAFSDSTLVENSDSTNIYYLKSDGTYQESYKGNLLSGTWEVQESESFTALMLTMDGTTSTYQYMVDTDESGNVTGISQYEGRSFTITEHSIPETITATPYSEAETEAE